MKFTKSMILLLGLCSAALAQNYRMDSFVTVPGGGDSHSADYQIQLTLGEPIAGDMASTSFHMTTGFWVGGVTLAPPTCDYVVGDANNSHTFTGLDVTYSVRYFKGGLVPPYSCECTPGHTWFVAGDVNGSCSYSGLDVTYMIRYFKGNAGPIPCPDCPPGGHLAPLVPGVIPTPAVQPKMVPTLRAKGIIKASD